MKTVTLSFKTIRDLLQSSSRCDMRSSACMYCIPGKDYRLKYTGETTKNLYKSIYEHKRNITLGNINDALFLHMSKTDHNFHLNAAMMFAHILKRLRQIFEAGAISLLLPVNTRPGFLNLSFFFLGKHLE